LASPLPSTPSAGRGSPLPLFGSLFGTMELSDFPYPFITAFLLLDSQRGPCLHQARPNMGPPGSRAKSLRTCSGSLTTQSPLVSRDNDTTSVAFRSSGQRQHSKVYNIFRGSIARPIRPLSTLRPYPYGYTRMTRGRCGSLLLHRLELSSITPYRSSRRTHENMELRVSF
jgi:hypothetical protein